MQGLIACTQLLHKSVTGTCFLYLGLVHLLLRAFSNKTLLWEPHTRRVVRQVNTTVYMAALLYGIYRYQ